nr:DAK2 domain-containing protein [Bacillus licheniformis]
MSIRNLDGKAFADMILYGAHHLSQNANVVDALNVFPVPDGDTGTNMNLSMTSGAKEVEQIDTANIGKVAQSLSRGLLMGARGNSGVILSQLFRGFGKSIEQKSEINAKEFARVPGRSGHRLQGRHETGRRHDLDGCQRCRKKSSALPLKLKPISSR